MNIHQKEDNCMDVMVAVCSGGNCWLGVVRSTSVAAMRISYRKQQQNVVSSAAQRMMTDVLHPDASHVNTSCSERASCIDAFRPWNHSQQQQQQRPTVMTTTSCLFVYQLCSLSWHSLLRYTLSWLQNISFIQNGLYLWQKVCSNLEF